MLMLFNLLHSLLEVATITAASGGVSTVTSVSSDVFPGSGLVKVNNLVQFSNPAKSNDPTYGRITVVGESSHNNC